MVAASGGLKSAQADLYPSSVADVTRGHKVDEEGVSEKWDDVEGREASSWKHKRAEIQKNNSRDPSNVANGLK